MNQLLTVINKLLSKPFASTRLKEELMARGTDFAEHFASSQSISESKDADDLKPLLSFLREDLSTDLEIIFSRILKMLLAKKANRDALGRVGIVNIIFLLRRQVKQLTSAAMEICGAILNSCYSSDNGQIFIDEGGMPLLFRLILVRDIAVRLSTLGAIQVLCFLPSGRQIMRQDSEVVGSL